MNNNHAYEYDANGNWYDADGERTVKTSDVRTYSVIKKMGKNMINFDDIHEQEQ